jgi:hypothetical protein
MSAQFTISVDPARHLVRIAMSGFFTPEDVTRFVRERAVAHQQLRCGPNQHVTINDLRAMKVQPQDTVATFGAVLSDPRYRSRKLAFVVSKTLARSQLGRALAGRDARCFETVAEAELWALADAARAA